MPEADAFGTLLLDAWEHLLAGGTVMLPLAVISLVMWSLVIFKLLELAALRRGEATLAVCRGREKRGSAWQREVLEGFARRNHGDPDLDRRLLNLLCGRIQARNERFVATILVLASLTPLLGLLGTVSGMITAFEAISDHGTGNIRALAGGISTALITTQTGLVIAVPGLVLGTFIRRRTERLAAGMERFRLELLRECGVAAPDGRGQSGAGAVGESA